MVVSDKTVRVYQQFATLDLISRGRAEIMAGRGSFIESFPLFGYDLNDYDELFAEKLDLLLQIRAEPVITWKGHHRAPLKSQGVYPRALQQPLPLWIASGGTPQSVARAGALGLPLAIATLCRCRSATNRRRRSSARSIFWARWSPPKCARNWRSGRFPPENGQ